MNDSFKFLNEIDVSPKATLVDIESVEWEQAWTDLCTALDKAAESRALPSPTPFMKVARLLQKRGFSGWLHETAIDLQECMKLSYSGKRGDTRQRQLGRELFVTAVLEVACRTDAKATDVRKAIAMAPDFVCSHLALTGSAAWTVFDFLMRRQEKQEIAKREAWINEIRNAADRTEILRNLNYMRFSREGKSYSQIQEEHVPEAKTKEAIARAIGRIKKGIGAVKDFCAKHQISAQQLAEILGIGGFSGE